MTPQPVGVKCCAGRRAHLSPELFGPDGRSVRTGHRVTGASEGVSQRRRAAYFETTHVHRLHADVSPTELTALYASVVERHVGPVALSCSERLDVMATGELPSLTPILSRRVV